MQSYDNQDFKDYVYGLVKQGRSFIINKFNNKTSVYFYIIPLKDNTGMNRVFCQMTCTKHVSKIWKMYDSIFLIGIKNVKNYQSWYNFKDYLNNNYNYLKMTNDVFVFDKRLYDDFSQKL